MAPKTRFALRRHKSADSLAVPQPPESIDEMNEQSDNCTDVMDEDALTNLGATQRRGRTRFLYTYPSSKDLISQAYVPRRPRVPAGETSYGLLTTSAVCVLVLSIIAACMAHWYVGPCSSLDATGIQADLANSVVAIHDFKEKLEALQDLQDRLDYACNSDGGIIQCAWIKPLWVHGQEDALVKKHMSLDKSFVYVHEQVRIISVSTRSMTHDILRSFDSASHPSILGRAYVALASTFTGRDGRWEAHHQRANNDLRRVDQLISHVDQLHEDVDGLQSLVTKKIPQVADLRNTVHKSSDWFATISGLYSSFLQAIPFIFNQQVADRDQVVKFLPECAKALNKLAAVDALPVMELRKALNEFRSMLQHTVDFTNLLVCGGELRGGHAQDANMDIFKTMYDEMATLHAIPSASTSSLANMTAVVAEITP